MIKKLTGITIAVMLVLSLLPLGTQATAEPRLTSESQTVTTDKSFTLDVALADNPGIISLRMQVSYDTALLQLDRVEDLGLLKGMTDPAPKVDSPYTLRWAESLATENNTANGSFVRLHFRSIAPTEKTTVSVTLTEARNLTGDKVSFANEEANITIHRLFPVAALPEEHLTDGILAHWNCDNCGKLFADENATTELSPSDIVIPAPGHAFNEEWSFDDNSHWHACHCGEIRESSEHTYDGDNDASCNMCGYIRSLPYIVGDINNDGAVTDSDAVYLLRHTLFKDDYPISQPADFNRDGSVTDSDAVYLLRHTLFKDDYPLDPL